MAQKAFLCGWYMPDFLPSQYWVIVYIIFKENSNANTYYINNKG